MNRFSLVQQVEKYIDEGFGAAWWHFWQHRNTCGHPREIVKTLHIDRTSYLLYCYMVQFGMGRSVAILPKYGPEDFQNLLRAYVRVLDKHDLWNLRPNRAQDLRGRSAARIDSAFDELDTAEVHRHGRSDLFLSKMMMALWGHTIACDRYFVAAFMRLHNGRNPGKMLWSELNHELLDKHQVVLAANRNRLFRLVRHRYGNQEVPILRLVDIAYWNFGRSLLDGEKMAALRHGQ